MLGTGSFSKLKDLSKAAQKEAAERGVVYCIDCGVPSKVRRSVCPNCGSSSIPCEASEQVVITINAHELRTVFHHAEKWCRAHGKGSGMLFSIVARIRDQLPSKKMLPTIESELEDDTRDLRNSSG